MKEPFPNDLRCSNFHLLKTGKTKVSAWQSWGTEEMPERQWRCAALREAAIPEAAEPDMDQSRGLAQPEARDGAGKALWLHPHGSGEHTTSSCSPGEAHGICVPEGHWVGSSRLSGQGRHGHMAWAGRDRDTPGMGREIHRQPWHGQGHPWHGQGPPAPGLTCRTMGSCSGGLRFSTPMVSHTWKAVSCSAKKGLCWGSKVGMQAWVKQQGVKPRVLTPMDFIVS